MCLIDELNAEIEATIARLVELHQERERFLKSHEVPEPVIAEGWCVVDA